MTFLETHEEDIDFEELFKDVCVPDANMYIADENQAVELISQLIKNENNTKTTIHMRRNIEKKINDLFSLFSDISIENELAFYERFMDLCSRLSEVHKIQKIQDKVVISLGGKVSAGKSKFINAISGIGDMLPVAQKTTTAIPTYIIKAQNEKISSNSVYGYSTEITKEALNAMAHEFDEVYGIGFPSFIDSIIIESSKYSLGKEIALLDTPGYTKYDEESNSKMVVSDRQKAFEQLSISDYLIWLIDIDSGAITEDDLDFIESLRISTPVLIVFTKADLKSDNEIKQIVECAEKTMEERSNINCFGITAYSSNTKKEYGKNRLIPKFFNFAKGGNVRNNDILSEFRKVENDMHQSILNAVKQSKNEAKEAFDYIKKSDKIIEIHSLAALWGQANQEGYRLDYLLQRYEKSIAWINKDIRRYIGEGE